MAQKIEYEDKVAIQNDDSVAEVNKVTDKNMNEIKRVVNANADEQTLQFEQLQAENAELKETIDKMALPGEAEGNPIYIEDSSDLSCEIILMENEEQEVTSDITTIEENSSVEITISNKNIFDIEKLKALDERNIYETYNGVECLKLRGISQTYVIKGKENTQYTFQFNVIAHTHTAAIGGFVLHYSDGTNSAVYPGVGTGKFTITSTANKTLIDITWNAWSAGNYIYIDKNSMQLEVGPTETNLVKHESQIVSLPIQEIGETETILNSFHTYKNVTNITANGITKLKVNYKKDLATVINNIATATVALGGNLNV